jgi:hypothetical protein
MKLERSATKELRILSVTFDSHLEPWELPKFRGAIAHKVGLEHEWFHNHKALSSNFKFHYRYPLIQYKLHQNNPMLLCIDQAVEEAQHFFSKPDWTLMIGDKQHDMRIKNLNVKQFSMNLLEEKKEYRIHNWLALNQANYSLFQTLDRLSEKLDFLEPILISNILSFAEGIGWQIPGQVELAITDLLNIQLIEHKQVKRMAFNLHFKSNVFIPNFIALGKGGSYGFGVIKENRQQGFGMKKK